MAEVRPEALAVMVAVPARVSLYLKLAELVPEVIVTLVIVAVSAVLRNRPPRDVLERVTVTFDDAFTGDPLFACSCTVIVFEVTPAVSTWAAVVNASFWAGGAASAVVAVGPMKRAIVRSAAAEAATLGVLERRTGRVPSVERFLDQVDDDDDPPGMGEASAIGTVDS